MKPDPASRRSPLSRRADPARRSVSPRPPTAPFAGTIACRRAAALQKPFTSVNSLYQSLFLLSRFINAGKKPFPKSQPPKSIDRRIRDILDRGDESNPPLS